MCCSNRQRRQRYIMTTSAPPRPQQIAHELPASIPNHPPIQETQRLEDINGEVLKGAGIPPPSYEKATSQDDSSDSSSVSSLTMFTPPSSVAGEDGGVRSIKSEKSLRKEAKKAEKAARKEMKKLAHQQKKYEKAARKAEKWAEKAARKAILMG